MGKERYRKVDVQSSPFIEITLATTICGEGDFLFMRVSIHLPSLYGIGVWDNGVALFS